MDVDFGAFSSEKKKNFTGKFFFFIFFKKYTREVYEKSIREKYKRIT